MFFIISFIHRKNSDSTIRGAEDVTLSLPDYYTEHFFCMGTSVFCFHFNLVCNKYYTTQYNRLVKLRVVEDSPVVSRVLGPELGGVR